MQNQTNTVPVADKPKGLKRTKQPKDLLRDALAASLEIEDSRELSGELAPEALELAREGADKVHIPSGLDPLRSKLDMRLEDGFKYENRRWTYTFWHPKIVPSVLELHKAGLYGNGLHLVETRVVSKDDPAVREDGDVKKKGKKGGGDGGDGGDFTTKDFYTRVTNTPVFPTKIIQDDRGEHFLEIQFIKPGRTVQWVTQLIKFSQLQKDNGAVWDELASLGLIIQGKKARPLFSQMASDLLALVNTEDGCVKYLEYGVSRPGWHRITSENTETEDDDKGELHYIAPGFSTNTKIRYTGSKQSAWTQKGNESLYLKRMMQMLRWNPTVFLMSGFNAAGYLVSHIKEMDHNPIWALVGTTSIGKTTHVEGALSWRGHPDTLIQIMDGSKIGIAKYLIMNNDGPATMDEIGTQDARMTEADKQGQLYIFGTGKPRMVSKRSGLTGEWEVPMDTPRSAYTFMLTGEKNLVDLNKAQGGNKVRLNSFVFDPETNPLWNTLNGVSKPENTEIEAWSRFLDENHGWLAPRIIYQIKDNLARYENAFTRFQKAMSKNLKSGAESRKGNSFALALTGCLVLRDTLKSIFDEETQQHIVGLRWADMGKVSRRAKELMQTTMEDAPIESDDDRFKGFLDTVMFKYQFQLHQVATGGASTFATQMPLVGQRKEYAMHVELAIEKSMLHTICTKEQISSDRFLKWAEDNGIYAKVEDSSGVKRTTRRIKINGQQTHCYVFVQKKEMPTDENGKALTTIEHSMNNVLGQK